MSTVEGLEKVFDLIVIDTPSKTFKVKLTTLLFKNSLITLKGLFSMFAGSLGQNTANISLLSPRGIVFITENLNEAIIFFLFKVLPRMLVPNYDDYTKIKDTWDDAFSLFKLAINEFYASIAFHDALSDKQYVAAGLSTLNGIKLGFEFYFNFISKPETQSGEIKVWEASSVFSIFEWLLGLSSIAFDPAG